ncbi:EthD domain-containing protein [Nitrobacter sp.]|uniref:EthD domain-containing protein n=1 Tax=Nitrobacter sp. TaxID=29420 RepID=UPI0039B57AD4
MKIIESIPSRLGLSQQAFHDYWRYPHGVYDGDEPAAAAPLFQCHRIDLLLIGDETRGYEGVAEVWFDSAAQGRVLFDNPYYATHVHLDNTNFADVDELVFLWAEEEVVQGRLDPPRAAVYDQEWSENNRGLSVKLFQFVEEDGDRPWCAEEDLELGLRIGVFRPCAEPIDRGRWPVPGRARVVLAGIDDDGGGAAGRSGSLRDASGSSPQVLSVSCTGGADHLKTPPLRFRSQLAVSPPSTGISIPVMNEAWSDSSQPIAAASSSASATR